MKHLLFVDDDPAFLNAIGRMLFRKKTEWAFHYARSVSEALEIAAQQPMDTIVSDVNMVGQTGFDLLAIMQSDPGFRTIPVIMVTGAMDTELKLTALEMGATDLLSKPVSLADLLARINGCLRLKAYQDELLFQKTSLEETVRKQTRQALLETEISGILVRKSDLSGLLQRCTDALVTHLDAAFARIWIYDEKKEMLELKASSGCYTHIRGVHQFIALGQFKIGKIAQDRVPHLTNAVIGDPRISDQDWAKRENMVAFAGYPLVVKDRLVGVMAMFSKKPIQDSVLSALASISDKVSIGIKDRQTEDMVHFLSFYDSLTDLPNRHFFYELVKKTMGLAQRHRQSFALALIDLDNFNRVNQSLGHVLGDVCLKMVSERLAGVVRKSDGLARGAEELSHLMSMGGDHFTVLLNGADRVEKVSHVVSRILKAVSGNYCLGGHEVFLTASIGVVLYPEDGTDVNHLLQNAEAALKHVKKKGKNDFGFYSSSMNAAALEFLDFETELRKAIKDGALSVVYQPKVDLPSGQLVGVEALARWQKPDGSFVSPSRFIPFAETNGLILPIGGFVLETACRQNREWQEQGVRPFGVAVNASAAQFSQKDFVPTVLSVLGQTGLNPEWLELEITETTIMADPQRAVRNLNELKAHGIRMSLDDFGTGYSSLSYLQSLPLDTLKIDLSFIRKVLTNPNDASIVKAIIALAHSLNLKVIAEGVEEQGQLAFLRAHDCDMIQGYLFSPPALPREIPGLAGTSLESRGAAGMTGPLPPKAAGRGKVADGPGGADG